MGDSGEGQDETHAADAGYAIFSSRSLLEHDIGFVLAKVEPWLLGCWLRHWNYSMADIQTRATGAQFRLHVSTARLPNIKCMSQNMIDIMTCELHYPSYRHESKTRIVVAGQLL